MKIVVYSDAQQLGGAEMTLGLVLSRLDAGVDVTIVGVDSEPVGWLAEQRPSSSAVVLDPIANRRDFAGMRAHRDAFTRLDADIIHFNLSTMSSCQWAMVAAGSIKGQRMVAVENSPMSTWSDRSTQIKQMTSARLSAHMAVGEATARMIEDSASLPRGSVGTLYHGVDPVEHHPPSTSDPRVLVGTIARFDRVKGLDILVEAFARVDDAARLVLIGSGAERDALAAQVDELGLGDRVEFRTVPWEESARDHLAGFDVFVLPSRLEGFPVTIMEAMLAGVPVVATDVGSVRESVADGVTGLVVPPGDVTALASAIDCLVEDEVLRVRLGSEGRRVGAERFTIGATADRYMAVYRSALADRVPSRLRSVAALVSGVISQRRTT